MVLTEEPLSGGNATDAVVRIGRTVRKPWTASAASVHELLRAVRYSGVPAPRPLGRDERGRQTLEYVPGEIAMLATPLAPDGLARVGRLIRSIHDACAAFTPHENSSWEVLISAEDEELVCHNDLAPWNLVLGERWVFIDWDGAGPSTRRWDLAYAAQSFTLNDVAQEPDAAGARLRALVDGYGPDAALRAALPAAVGERATAMRDLLRTARIEGRESWATMHDDGHGAHWTAAAEYAVAHREVWAAALA